MAATKRIARTGLCLFWLVSLTARAAVLPEDRADALYHSYDGGGVEVTGPSILVRKGDNKSFSVSGNYYVDSISSASIDVLSQGSAYSEERTQTTISGDYLHADTMMSISYSNSDESDYTADTGSFTITQSMFGDLTTVTLGYVYGSDDVRRNGDATFAGEVQRQQFQLALSQVLTKKLILAVNFENVTEEGFLNNPYRSVRYLDPTSPLGYSFEAERYPNTRTSNALAARLRYHLPYRAALGLGYRYFTDDWNIDAHSLELDYTHPMSDVWSFELGYRFYTQSESDFYSDLFPRQDHQNFLARDKELSEFHDHSVSIGVSYNVLREGWGMIDRATVNAQYRRILFAYEDFRDLTGGGTVGEEAIYDFSADVFQLYFSAWF